MKIPYYLNNPSMSTVALFIAYDIATYNNNSRLKPLNQYSKYNIF
jgi:hypothetical protein